MGLREVAPANQGVAARREAPQPAVADILVSGLLQGECKQPQRLLIDRVSRLLQRLCTHKEGIPRLSGRSLTGKGVIRDAIIEPVLAELSGPDR